MKGLIQANLKLLRQGESLLTTLGESSYTRPEPMFYNSTVGGHLRHCLEHYEAFCKAFSDGEARGKIDYDARCRDREVEHKTDAAEARIKQITTAMEKMENEEIDPGVLVKMDCGTAPLSEGGADLWQPSTVGRELQFLVSHTVHHFAMIRGICQAEQIPFTEEFGVAPSTMKYRKELCEDSGGR